MILLVKLDERDVTVGLLRAILERAEVIEVECAVRVSVPGLDVPITLTHAALRQLVEALRDAQPGELVRFQRGTNDG